MGILDTYSRLPRCSTARGLFSGDPKEVPLRLRLIWNVTPRIQEGVLGFVINVGV